MCVCVCVCVCVCETLCDSVCMRVTVVFSLLSVAVRIHKGVNQRSKYVNIFCCKHLRLVETPVYCSYFGLLPVSSLCEICQMFSLSLMFIHVPHGGFCNKFLSVRAYEFSGNVYDWFRKRNEKKMKKSLGSRRSPHRHTAQLNLWSLPLKTTVLATGCQGT